MAAAGAPPPATTTTTSSSSQVQQQQKDMDGQARKEETEARGSHALDSLIPEAGADAATVHAFPPCLPSPLPMRPWHETHVRGREAATDSAGYTVCCE